MGDSGGVIAELGKDLVRMLIHPRRWTLGAVIGAGKARRRGWRSEGPAMTVGSLNEATGGVGLWISQHLQG